MKSSHLASWIRIKGAKTHNLKNVSAEIPKNTLTVFTGPSGSGKSSLAFDTLFAEGQRRYLESISNYAKQFIHQLPKPDYDVIEGLSPTVAIEQRTISGSSRSTLGTLTEISDHLRLLYAKVAQAYCPQCEKPVMSSDSDQITHLLFQVLTEAAQKIKGPLPMELQSFGILLKFQTLKCSLFAPIIREKKGEHRKLLADLQAQGFLRVLIDGKWWMLDEEITLEKTKHHSLSVLIDQFVIQPDQVISLEKIKLRLHEAVQFSLEKGKGECLVLFENEQHKKHTHFFSNSNRCSACEISLPLPSTRLFSFNTLTGACEQCKGLGIELPGSLGEEELEEWLDKSEEKEKASQKVCSQCHGNRLKKESLSFYLSSHGVRKNIAELSNLSIEQAYEFLKGLTGNAQQSPVVARIVSELSHKFDFLLKVGVGYLSLSRRAPSLSGGESQRIRLATQLGASMVHVTYVLDEPSIGLHPKDQKDLLRGLHDLRDQGNTVIVVEHDRETMEGADWILDFGPGAGIRGGELVAQGDFKHLQQSASLTGKYLRGELVIKTPTQRRKPNWEHAILVKGCKMHNLKNLHFKMPLGLFVGISGVSGSGKSTLISDTLSPALTKLLDPFGPKSLDYQKLQVDQIQISRHLKKKIEIDQKPIGRSPRSNPATYTGIFDAIRSFFAMLPEAKQRGFGPGRFSFNVAGGRCETCKGDGSIRLKMNFLPDSFITCLDCRGKRYHSEVLQIRFKGKNISEILSMSISQALELFQAIPQIQRTLCVLEKVGLGYLSLGQSATTLSGGEAQRLKLARELAKRQQGNTLYLLDEPSTGLHFDDIQKIIEILQGLVNQGNTVCVIEHNLDFLKVVDYLIDLGPEGGQGGGYILAEGTPEQVAKNPKSVTGVFLKKVL